MSTRRAIVALALALTAGAAEPPVALIYKLEGETEVISGIEDQARPAELFDWLNVGDEVRVRKEGAVGIAFVTGVRFEIPGPAVVEVAPEGFRRIEGKVEPRPPLPPIPRPAGTIHAEDAFATTRLGGVVLRGAGLAWVYPRKGMSTIARHTTLRFGAGAEATTGFRVVLEDEDGAVLLHTVVKDAEVALPPDLLAEGRRYYWRVLALGETGTNGTGEGEFLTLDSTRSSERRIFQEPMAKATDPYVIALGAEADRSLGLLWEARDGFCRAHLLSPDDTALRRKCEELESRLRN